MKQLINIFFTLFIISCSSLPERPTIENLDEQKSISRRDFIHIFGPILLKNRPVLGVKNSNKIINYYSAGLCYHTFDKTSLDIHISKAEVASCITPFISVAKTPFYFTSNYKDLDDNTPFQQDVLILIQYKMLQADSELFFGSYRPITGKELLHIIKILDKNKF